MNELDEIRKDAIQRTILIQNKRFKWHDKLLKRNNFQEGDWPLFFDSRFKNFKGKITTKWTGPYEIITIFYNGYVKISTIDDEQVTFVVNGHRLKVYHNPITKQEFIQALVHQSDLELVGEEKISSPSFS